jgi:outer membrane lipoprotein SlyB
MNITRKLTPIIIATVALTLGACASAPRKPVYYVDAQVLKVTPAPEVCRYKKKSNGGNLLLGALIGGAIGNQFGSGGGRKLATVGGALLGATAASDGGREDKMGCRSDGYLALVAYMHPKTNMYVTTRVPLKERTRAQYIEIPVE